MAIKIITLFTILLYSFQINAQTKATTENGKAVILYNDGIWSEEITDINNCKELIKEVTTNKTKGFMSVKPIKISNKKTSLTIEFIKNENVTVIDMKVVGSDICFGPKDIAIFTILDGTEIKLPYSSSVASCKGDFTIFIGDVFKNQELTEKLSTDKIKTIQLKTHHFDVKEFESNLFQNSLKCLNSIK